MIKSGYLQLLVDRELAIKFGADKEKEADELCLQLSMTHYSLYQAENQTSNAAVHKQDEIKYRKMEIVQIVEGMKTICEHESNHNICTILHPKKTHYANEDHRDQQEDNYKNPDFYISSYTPSRYHEPSHTTSETTSDADHCIDGDVDLNDGTYGHGENSELFLTYNDGFHKLSRDLSSSS